MDELSPRCLRRVLASEKTAVKAAFQHVVPPGTPSQRLDRYLAQALKDHSRAQIQRWIAEGCVRLSGRRLKASHRVVSGEELEIEIPPPEVSDLKAEKIPLDKVYEDEYLLVINKPAGMVVHPAPGNPTGTLVNALLAHSSSWSAEAGPFKPGIVHRLDKETSGLLVVAKDDRIHRDLSRQFAERKVLRLYLAVVQGSPARDEGTISAPIGRHPVRRQKMSVQYGTGREAVTRYRVLRRLRRAAVLELSLQTGRTHQVRVHLAHLGHPLLGDMRYGVLGGFSRQALHACRLGFEHPHTGRLPDDRRHDRQHRSRARSRAGDSGRAHDGRDR
jgi:23S rRNA pseudouridine1911/1915/1917 synthase